MAIRSKVVGLKSLQKKLRAIPAENRKGVRGAIAKGAAGVQGDAKRGIERGSRSGVVIVKGGKRHQRSAPGEFPKTDTGRLASSIFAEVEGDGLSAEVGTDVKYGEHLEFGTRDGSLGARPWLQPSFEKNKAKIKDDVEKAANAANRRATKK